MKMAYGSDKLEKVIGFIGLGAMGKPMAENFLKAGYELNVFDVSALVMEKWKKTSANLCKNVTEVAEESDIIFSSLPNGKIVQSIMEGEEGVLASCKTGSVIVDLSSVAPETSENLCQKAGEKGVCYLDSPVSGGVTGAQKGTLTLMVGGDREAYEAVLPELNCIGKNIFYIGKSGSGDAMKIVNNLLLGCNMAALAEALILGEKCGLDLKTMKEIISISSGRSYVSEAKLENFIMPESYEGGFAISLQHKDLSLALEAGKAVTMPLPMTSMAAQIYELAKAEGLSRKDISALVKMWSEHTLK